jgi:hypothetical protein
MHETFQGENPINLGPLLSRGQQLMEVRASRRSAARTGRPVGLTLSAWA